MPDSESDLIKRIQKKLDYRNAPFGRDCHGKPWHLELEFLLFGMVRIIVTDGNESVERWWEYETEAEANEAIELWLANGFEDEPEGWRRASPENPEDAFKNSKIRYRPGLREEQERETVYVTQLTKADETYLKLWRPPLPVVKYDPVKDSLWK